MEHLSLKTLALAGLTALALSGTAVITAAPAEAQVRGGYEVDADEDDLDGPRVQRRLIDADEDDELPRGRRPVIDDEADERRIIERRTTERSISERRVVEPVVERRIIERRPVVREIVERPVVRTVVRPVVERRIIEPVVVRPVVERRVVRPVVYAYPRPVVRRVVYRQPLYRTSRVVVGDRFRATGSIGRGRAGLRARAFPFPGGGHGLAVAVERRLERACQRLRCGKRPPLQTSGATFHPRSARFTAARASASENGFVSTSATTASSPCARSRWSAKPVMRRMVRSG